MQALINRALRRVQVKSEYWFRMIGQTSLVAQFPVPDGMALNPRKVTFTASGDAPVNLEVPPDVFNDFLLNNSIPRIGSYDYVANSALFPVYDITKAQFMDIFGTPPDSGKYAFGLVFDSGGAAGGSMSLKLTPVH